MQYNLGDITESDKIRKRHGQKKGRYIKGHMNFGVQEKQTHGQITITMHGSQERSIFISNVALKRHARYGFTEFTLAGISADNSLRIKIAFNDKGMVQKRFEIPEEAQLELEVQKGSQNMRFNENGQGRLLITSINADEIKGKFNYTGHYKEKQLAINGYFTAQDGLF